MGTTPAQFFDGLHERPGMTPPLLSPLKENTPRRPSSLFMHCPSHVAIHLHSRTGFKTWGFPTAVKPLSWAESSRRLARNLTSLPNQPSPPPRNIKVPSQGGAFFGAQGVFRYDAPLPRQEYSPGACLQPVYIVCDRRTATNRTTIAWCSRRPSCVLEASR